MIISFSTGKIETKGGGGNLQQKKVTVTENGLDVIVPDAGYDGFSTVYVKTYVSNDSGMKDFSIIGYDDGLNVELNEEIDNDIAYSKSVKDDFRVGSNFIQFDNKSDLIYFPFIDFKTLLKGDGYVLKITNNSNLKVIPDLDLSHFSSANFDGNYRLTKLGISDWSTLNPSTTARMFYGCTNLTSLDLTTLNTSNVTNMSYMFTNCKGFTSLDLSSFDTSKVTTMDNMFESCNKLKTLDLSSWDTSKVTDMDYMFAYCSGVTSLNLSGWDVSNVKGFDSIFNSCSSLTSLNIGGWDLSRNLTNYYLPFYTSLPNLTDLVFGVNRKVSLSFSSSTKLTVESLLSVLNGLYDFTGNGETPTSSQGKLTLGSTNLAKLSDEQKAIATGRGWVLN